MSDTFDVEVGPKGRVVIPAPVRTALGIQTGTRLALLVDDGAIVMAHRDVLRSRIRALFASVQTSMADELLEERRMEAEADR